MRVEIRANATEIVRSGQIQEILVTVEFCWSECGMRRQRGVKCSFKLWPEHLEGMVLSSTEGHPRARVLDTI